MKICRKCGAEKELSHFYKHSGMSDGHLNVCQECIKAYSKQHRTLNPTYYEEYEKQRQITPKRLKLNYETTKKYRQENPERYRAVNKLNNAVRAGKVSKLPCLVCGETKVVGHHVHYDLPLEVTWLCQKHHKELHAGIDRC
jgi:hypothetical protein